MSREEVEVVRRVYEAVPDDWETVLAGYAADVEWDDREMRPEGAIHRGVEAMRQEMRMWFGTWRNYHWETERIVDAGNDVVVIGRERGEGKGSGVTLDQQVCLVVTVRDGLIVRTRVFKQPAQAFQAAGLSE